MNVTSKGRYALMVMIDLAQHPDDGFISLKTIADRQAQTDAAVKEIEAEIKARPNTILRTVEVFERESDGDGTHLFEALAGALGDVPPDRLAGIDTSEHLIQRTRCHQLTGHLGLLLSSICTRIIHAHIIIDSHYSGSLQG